VTQSIPGKITIAPNVLTTIVEQTALDAGGVLALGPHSPRIRKVDGHRAVSTGVEAIVKDNTVVIAVSVQAAPDINMLTLAQQLQRDIAHNIEHILGMKVARVDVYIDDVAFSQGAPDPS